MVTLQEIEERENALKEVEKEAVYYVSTPIPKRRYGVGVTREQQAKAYERRGEGKRVLTEVNKQRQELKEIKARVILEESRRREEGKIIQESEDYKRGYQAAISGRPKPSGSQAEKKGWEEGQNIEASSRSRTASLKEYNAQIEKYKSEGLSPVTDKSGKVIAFKDEKLMMSISLESIPKFLEDKPRVASRYERAGVVEMEKVEILSEIPQSRPTYKPFFEKVENVIKYPFEKAANFENYLANRKKTFPKYESGFGIIKVKTQSNADKDTFGAKGFRFVGDLAAFPVYGLKRGEQLIFDKQYKEEVRGMTLGEGTLEGLNVALSLYSSKKLGESFYNYFKKPIVIREEPKLKDINTAKTEIRNIRVEDKLLNVGKFEVVTYSPSQKAYTIPRITSILRGVKTKDPRLTEMSLKELNLAFPEGKIIELRPARTSRSITEPFIIENGRIKSALGRRGEPGVFSYRETYHPLTGKRRFTSKKFSVLSGENYEERVLKTLSKGRNELTPEIKRGLEELEKLPSYEELNLKKVFNKELKLSSGGIRLEELFKITNKGLKAPKLGKKISRAEVSTIQERIFKTKFETKQPSGLTELEIFKENIGAVDVTFPKVRYPRKAINIKGKVTRLEYELPVEGDLGFRGGGQKTKLKFDLAEIQKPIQEGIGNLAINQKAVNPKVRSQIKETNLKPITSGTSAFIGTGLYERTEVSGSLAPPSIREAENYKIAPDYSIKNLNIPRTNYFSKEVSKDISKEISKEINKEVSKEISKELTKSIPRLANKQVNKQITKTITKNIIKNPPKTPTINVPRIIPPRTTTTKNPPKVPSLSLGGSFKDKNLVFGYKPYVIKRGKRVYLEGVFEKEEALSLGQKEAINTLRATFGVEKTKIKVKDKNLNFKPIKAFRGYKIREGKKIPLKNTYIQKRGYRLSSFGEVKEIQRARLNRL